MVYLRDFCLYLILRSLTSVKETFKFQIYAFAAIGVENFSRYKTPDVVWMENFDQGYVSAGIWVVNFTRCQTPDVVQVENFDLGYSLDSICFGNFN